MKKILITGANGLLGQALLKTFSGEFEILAADLQEGLALALAGQSPGGMVHYQPLDISDPKNCREVVLQNRPDIIINAAAYTNVDGCETDKDLCWKVNVKGVENLAAAARRNMALVVHISTDYIFDGAEGPYGEDHKPNPLGYYGKSKLASENAVRVAGIPYAIVRTNVLYGAGVNVKNNFFLWVYHSLKSGKTINVVTDQWNNPTLAEELSEGIRLLIEKSKYGVYHIGGKEYLNRFDFALRIAEVFGFPRELIRPITTDQLKQEAPRPMRGGVKIERARSELGFDPRPLKNVLEQLKARLEGSV
ncbi:MAG: dTDP-4-dehydrorhamnose reductase [Calditrichaceae bacterium]|nr:dTDP-4-dehydrorhamnose reductase [Calditrichia bacterium]NUQ40897.1 dTDP-4-dehydrorhamnose reductase [Calditrichaceae bacterium]